jgi:hypothetical protein
MTECAHFRDAIQDITGFPATISALVMELAGELGEVLRLGNHSWSATIVGEKGTVCIGVKEETCDGQLTALVHSLIGELTDDAVYWWTYSGLMIDLRCSCTRRRLFTRGSRLEDCDKEAPCSHTDICPLCKPSKEVGMIDILKIMFKVAEPKRSIRFIAKQDLVPGQQVKVSCAINLPDHSHYLSFPQTCRWVITNGQERTVSAEQEFPGPRGVVFHASSGFGCC